MKLKYVIIMKWFLTSDDG